MPSMVGIIKQASMEAVEASKPAALLYGTVISESPVKVEVDQQRSYSEPFLILSRNVTDYLTEMTIGGKRQSVTVHNRLKRGEQVMLLRVQGGQRFIVIDRVGG